LKTAKHIWDGMHLFVLAKLGLGEAVHASGQRPKCAFPAKKTALQQWFFCFRDFGAGSTFAANNADKETDFSHGREKLPKLLPPSHKLGELQTSPQLSSPPVCAFCIGRELSGVFGSAGWMMADITPPHLDLSRLLLMAR
jgi:hypothetical protein